MTNVVAVLAYLGGPIVSIVILAVEKKDAFVRFHAMQSTITFLLVLVVNLLLRNVPVVGRFLWAAFWVGAVLLWGLLMFKAFRGERYKLPYIGDFAERQLK